LAIVVAGESRDIKASAEHPFFARNQTKRGHWMPASNLIVGDQILTKDGDWRTVLVVAALGPEQTVYNFEVDGNHDYFVGETGLLVHNGGLCLYKWGKDTGVPVQEGDYNLYLPDQGSEEANWIQNEARLRDSMGEGNPIYDTYRDPGTGEQIPTDGFLGRERGVLESEGWTYNPSSGAYLPPQ